MTYNHHSHTMNENQSSSCSTDSRAFVQEPMNNNGNLHAPPATLLFGHTANTTTLSTAMLALFGFLTFLVLHTFLQSTVFSTFSHWRRPSLKGKWSPIMGNLIEMQRGNPGEKQMEWSDTFGGAVVYRGLLGNERLLLSDPRALMYVLQTRCYQFPKPSGARSALSNLLGQGVLTTEGDVHKRQRKIINPTFSQSSVAAFLPLFFRHANALADHLCQTVKEEQECDAGAAGVQAKQAVAHTLSPSFIKPVEQGIDENVPNFGAKETIVDVLHWTSRTTLDVIGESAFSYKLNSLEQGEHGDVIADSFNKMMTHVGQLTLWERAQLHFEQFSIFDRIRPLPTSFNKRARACFDAVESVAKRMVRERKQGVALAETEKDVLERVLRANEDPNVKPNQRLAPHEIMGQLTTLILAGHETTSTALTWALYQLAMHPSIQQDVRDEVRRAQQDSQHFAVHGHLSYDELHGLRLLNNVTNEVMRLNPPVQSTNREAAQDDVIPLKYPIKAKHGRPDIHQIPVRKGQPIIVHVNTFNRRKDLWGHDADLFNPSRWSNLPKPIVESGVPGFSLSFLAGPRNCVGQKFALTEFKAILGTLLCTFAFAPPPGDVKVDAKQVIVTRPRIRGMESAGTQMPLSVLPLSRSF